MKFITFSKKTLALLMMLSMLVLTCACDFNVVEENTPTNTQATDTGSESNSETSQTESESNATQSDTQSATETDTSTDAPTDAPTDTPTDTQATTESAEAEDSTDTDAPEMPTESDTDNVNPDHIETVFPNPLMVPDMAISGNGYDIFQMREDTSWGYRYGCTYLYNDDGSVDAYFACPGANGEWDWIAYRHSSDNGNTWTPEKMILNPTQGSMDFYSNCDPGVVYFGGYYYLGYTSTLHSKGACNNLFVARSRNPDGPFEKWNGTGWGGEHPQPIVYYTTDYSKFGMGEPSFVELNGTLYIYYTNTCPSGEYTMVATADSTDENWPAHMQFHGVAVEKKTDSLDIKYVEDWGKFVGIGTGERFSANSWIGVFESNDGIHFEMVDIVKKDTYSNLHNAGISSRRNGHINLAEDANKLCVIYAYGKEWGQWNARIQPITLKLADKACYKERMEAEKKTANVPDPANRAPAIPEGERRYIMVRNQYDVYEYDMSKGSFTLEPFVYDEYFTRIPITLPDINLSFKVHDEKVITIDGLVATIRGVGSTTVEIRYSDHLVNVFYVNILENKTVVEGNPIVSFVPVFDSYTVYIGEKDLYRPQIRGKLWYSDGSFEELYVDESDKVLTFSGYNESIISVSNKGILQAKALGETTVKITYGSWSCNVKITVTDDESLAYYKLGNAPTLDYTSIDFTKSESAEVIVGTNNATATFASGGLQLVVKDAGTTADMTDAFIRLDYSQSAPILKTEDYTYLEITYKVSTTNSNNATQAQVFICAGSVTSESASCQVLYSLQTDGEFHTVKLDLSQYSWWTGELHRMRFDFFTSSVGGDTMTVSSIKLTK